MTAGVTIAELDRHLTLGELNERAELLTRTDRKYIVDAELLGRLLASNSDDLAVLDIDGRREFGYESVYFDTCDLRLYRDAATSRRVRFKVRTRLYRDADLTVLEVKAKDGRGQTIKSRLDYAVEDRHRLTAAAHEFVDGIAARPGVAATLQPVLTTAYLRATLVDLLHGSRFTVDRGLVCTDPSGIAVGLDDVIIETKSGGATSPIDRWLWREGLRPVRISKYCTALAAMRPELPANKWHRTLARHFH